MTIKHLKIMNYRRFARLELEFPENLIGIIGRNGAGKSTIIEAIGWALYGNRIKRTDKHDIRSQFADKTDSCRVEMEFVYGGEEFRIIRTLKGQKAISEAVIYRQGCSDPVAVQDRGVNEYVEKLLHLDYPSFFASIFAKQKDLAAFTSMQTAERLKSINRLINIDVIDQTREDVRRDKSAKQQFISGIRSGQKDMDELVRTRKAIAGEHRELLTKTSTVSKSVKDSEKILKQTREHYAVQESLRDEFNDLASSYGQLQSRLAVNKNRLRQLFDDRGDIEKAKKEYRSLEPDLSAFPNIKAEKERLDEAAAQHALLKGRIEERYRLTESLDKQEIRLKQLRSQGERLNELLVTRRRLEKTEFDLEKQISVLRRKIQKTLGQKQVADEEGQKATQKLKGIKSRGPDGECPECTQKLADHYERVVQNYEQLVKKLRTDYLRYRGEEEQLHSDLRSLETRQKEARTLLQQAVADISGGQQSEKHANDLKGNIEEFRLRLGTLDSEIASLKAIDYDIDRHAESKKRFDYLLALQQKAAQLEERLGRELRVNEDISQTEKTIGETEEEMSKIQSRQTSLQYDEKVYSEVKRAVEKATQNWNTAKDKLSAVREELARVKTTLEAIDREIAEQKRLSTELESAKQELAYLDLLDGYLGSFRLVLSGRIRPIIARRTSELLALTTSGRYNMVELDPDYNIKIYDGNVPFPIDRFSGGEQDLVNLCLRVAISQVVAERSGGAPIRFIVLDEIFGSQDSERRELIIEALAKLSARFSQIFIITHIEQIRDILPVVVEVSQKNELISSAEMV
jgi:exonuclease SbcC